MGRRGRRSGRGRILKAKAGHYLAAWILQTLAGVLCLLPVGAALWVGRRGGRIASRLFRARRQIAEHQLRAALGLDEREARRQARRVFEHLGWVAAEIAVLPRLRPRLAQYVEFPEEDQRVLRQALEAGRGVVFVSAHLGNWELLAQRVASEGFPCSTVVRRATNPRLDPWLDARRRAGGLETIARRAPRSSRRLLRALRDGRLIGMLIDQDTRVDSVSVSFFGRSASTPVAPAALAISRDLPVVVGVIARRADGGHSIRIEAVSPPPVGPDRAERVRQLTQELTGAIERAIRRRPHEWVWIHERWGRLAP